MRVHSHVTYGIVRNTDGMKPPMKTLEVIWNEHRAALRSFLRKRVADPEDVDDLLQEILIRTHGGLPRLREEENLQAWLYRIARNVTVDHYRRAGRDRAVHADDLWYSADDPDTLTELEGCVAPFLAGPPSEEADLLAAVDLGGVSQKDYATEQGISYSTLKSRVQSARRDLRKLFDDCCRTYLDAQGRLVDYRPKSGHCEIC